MFKNIRKSIVTLLSAVTLVAVPIAVPVMVSAADINTNLCTGANLSTTPTTCAATSQEGTTRIDKIITSVINIFSLVVGIVAVVMIIIGGLRYITSGGESSNVTGAKNTIIYAIIGLVVVALAQFIVKFVLGKVTG